MASTRTVGPPAGLVDVWYVHLDAPEPAYAALVATLDPLEQEHAARLRVGSRAWAAARGAQRVILSTYLRVPASALQFSTGPAGKPRLADAQGLEFSLSHTGGLAVLAVARDREVGVDVERENDRTDVGSVACEFLPPGEAAALDRMPPKQRRSAFFRAWTRYEARLKLHGAGLTHPCVTPHSAATPVRVHTLALPPGFAGAVAATGNGWTVRVLNLADEHSSAAH